MTTFPLLQSQLGIFLAWETEPSTTGYNLPSYMPFSQHISGDVLADALREVIDDHPELRTRFTPGPHGEPRQFCDKALTIPIVRRKMSEQQAQHYIAHDFVRPFEPYGDSPLCRFEIVETPIHTYLLCDFSHTIADGITIARNFMGRDLPAAYHRQRLMRQGKKPDSIDRKKLPGLSMYDYALEEEAAFGSEAYRRAKAYYAEHFSGVAFTSLAAEVSEPWGQWVNASEQVDANIVDEWCASNATTANELFMAAFSLMLSRLSDQRRVAFFCLNHGRFTRRVADAYGMFVRSVPIVADVMPQTAIRQFVGSFRSQLTASVRHHCYPFSHFCRDLGVVPNVTFGFQSSQISEHTELDGELSTGVQLHQGRVKNSLGCMVYVVPGAYELRFDSSEAYYSMARLQMLARAFATCVKGICNGRNATLADLALTSTDEQRQIMELSQSAPTDYDPTDSTLKMILRQADSTPDSPAVSDSEGTISYRELTALARERASELAARGIGKGMVVPLTAVRNRSFVADVLALWLLGAAYMPVAPDEPEPRRRQMMAEADGKTADAAYVIYTSGSTGKPKGVVVSHCALLNLVCFIRHEWHLSERSRIACHSSFAFDASVEDLFPVLTVGGTLYIVPEEARRDLPRLEQFLNRHRITGGCFTTSLGLMLAERGRISPDYLCLGGEKLTRCPRTTIPIIYNTYGPTEFTVDATWHRLSPSHRYDEVPIGRPVAGCAAYVVDCDMQLLPRGAVGELCLAGPQMASGYLGDAQLTARKFVGVPFADLTVYRTGDMARWNARGELEFMGRRDQQLKLRGYRIEPTEVERVIMQVPQVTNVAVALAARGDDSVLCAFYSADSQLPPPMLMRHVQAHLPTFMVPSAWQQMDTLPLSSSGKVDRKRLPTTAPPPLTDYVEPANDEERLWCDIMQSVLGGSRIGATDDFFLSGGTSLKVVDVQIEAARRGRKLSYAQLFSHPTPRQMALLTLPESSPQPVTPTNGPTADRQPACKKTATASAPSGEGYLVTGATGLLGAHVAHWLLRNTDQSVYCLVRNKGSIDPQQRLRQTMIHYFATDSDSLTADRLRVVVGDIRQLPSAGNLPRVGTVIHCAADIRQYATGNSIRTTNVDGTQAVADYCIETGARLIHISTTSAGSSGTALSQYVASKIESEEVVGNAAGRGLQACIARVGNLMPRISDGLFVPDSTENGFFMLLRALAMMGCYPREAAQTAIDLSPVDLVAEAVGQLATAEPLPHRAVICHQQPPRLGQLAICFGASGSALAPVTADEFGKNLTLSLKNPVRHEALLPLMMLLEQSHSLPETTAKHASQSLTKWPLLTDNYLEKIICIALAK